jgi:small conductance mechanosensitive channel
VWTITPADLSVSSVLWSVAAIIATLIAAHYAARGVSRLGDRLPQFGADLTLRAARVVRYVVLILGACVVLSIIGAPVQPLIAVVLLLFGAVILMARGIADNLGAGLVLQARHPVKVGDRISSCGHTGRVADLTSRTVVLETSDGVTIHLPNQRVMHDPLVNESTLGRLRSEIQVRLSVQRGPGSIATEQRLIDGAGAAEGVLREPPPDLLLVAWEPDRSAYRATFSLRYWHLPGAEDEVCSRVTREIRRLYESDDAQIALVWPAPPPPLTEPGVL